MPVDREERGFIAARAVTREYARTFYLASQLLPADKRRAVFALYAVCRATDESVDDLPSAASQERLERISSQINLAYTDSDLPTDILSAFRHTVRAFAIPKTYFEELLEGMRMDLSKNRYADFAELCLYCYRVAGVIGLIMMKVLGCQSDNAQKHAVDLGIALQLTNIIRDIGEDLTRGRIYVPQDELRRFGVEENDLGNGRVRENFIQLLKFQVGRARSYYERSREGIRSIPGLRERAAICAVQKMYAGILDEIERSGYDVFSRRASVRAFRKTALLSSAFLEAFLP